MKIALAAVAALALTALTGCSGDDGSTAKDPSSREGGAETTDLTKVEPTVGTYPELEADDYTYVLEQQCFCPLAGPVKVTVEGGEVTSAVLTRNSGGMKKGTDAPKYLWITLDDVIARANDTKAAKVDVDWPDGQDWPNKVAVDQIENATDDEITYVVRGVEIQ